MKKAVCVLIKHPTEDKYLGVARRDNHSAFGLPGGKVDDDDTSLVQAAIRELFEETKIKVLPESLIEIFKLVCPGGSDGVDYKCTTYFTTEYTGEPKQGDAGPVEWVTKHTLLEGPFGSYNKELFKSYEGRSRFKSP